VFGPERSLMETVLEVQSLSQEMADLDPKDQILHVDLAGRDPDAGFTQVPYVKGMLFLTALEQAAGRPAFDSFLRGYFDHFAFQSITTADFVAYLDEHLLQANPGVAGQVPVEEWINEPELPESSPVFVSQTFGQVDESARQWLTGEIPAGQLPTKGWTTQHWLHFLRALPEELSVQQMRSLDQAFGLTGTGNSEIVSQWLLMAVRNGYEPAYPRLEQFLTSVGRRKFLRPLYSELVKTEQGRQRAEAIYAKARSLYHPIAADSIDEIVMGE